MIIISLSLTVLIRLTWFVAKLVATISYLRMIPLRFESSGACQLKVMELELTDVAMTFLGGDEGAKNNENSINCVLEDSHMLVRNFIN